MLIISTLLKATFDSLNFILNNDAGCIETSSSTHSNVDHEMLEQATDYSISGKHWPIFNKTRPLFYGFHCCNGIF